MGTKPVPRFGDPGTKGAFKVVHAENANLLSVKDAAAALGVSASTVYELCERGALTHLRILNAIRIDSADLNAFVAAKKRSPASE